MLALVLAGCSSGPGATEPQVATLPSTPASTSTSSGSGTGSQASTSGPSATSSARPQMRLDDTEERRNELIQAYFACLVKHGARYSTKEHPGDSATAVGTGPGAPTVADPIPASATAACRNEVPLEPPELEPDQNPHYRDDSIANVKCLRAHGYKVHLTHDSSPGTGPNTLTWTYDEDAGELPDNATQIENTCQLTAFGHSK
jgi:hypothetical protein